MYIQFIIIHEGRLIMAKLKKTPKQFRLDFDCIAFLEAIRKKKDMTETDVVQMAISEMAKRELTAEERERVLMARFQEILKAEDSD
jgi:hypothetical protein